MMASSRIVALIVVVLGVLVSCGPPPELTEEKAREIIDDVLFEVEPVYAEVPRVVQWNPSAPKDSYDETAVRTLRNLEREGLVILKETAEGGSYRLEAETTREGFPVLGVVPSPRGPAYRARIAEKKLDGMGNFVRHPNEPTVGRAEVIWHYENPTRFYDLFETKIDKPLGEPFASLVSFRWEKGAWRFGVVARKVRPSRP